MSRGVRVAGGWVLLGAAGGRAAESASRAREREGERGGATPSDESKRAACWAALFARRPDLRESVSIAAQWSLAALPHILG
jgi:hypothetical protein